ncbi:Crotonobetainyl-CoA:carnitine CoA-transferase CaiB and related acyl-CoA transferases [Chelatococcus sambhunathii]|uniref:Crotonobetainyl-CoA:carnitine CoA-transferase CaiB and related acyl-CoA transferases n=1 Tax=Chelatococcus sambhunathii TaxID=363953 RepID=A0ABM9U0W9_9HYPH|nr:CoA transferase [Chelatococcus sambhunathii]CUA85578.1 Crotonobetainyl-CoA:carnitine CoA-transferase CaiB and related acyl-CoA transferases [Chelatococcus sambhunathii]
MSGGAAMKPLADLRVLDFSRVLAGPYCTALLADLGAEVIKVEPPGGDDYRHIGPFVDGESMLFATVNRGKRSIVLDLAKADDLAIAHALAARADVVVENFRPGVADKLGIGWAQLSALNPRLVYASISGFGQEGELAKRPAYDVILQAMSGIMAVTGEPDGPPTLVGESIADVAAGLFASWAVLAALHERHGTGRGRHIDLAMFDAIVALQPLVVARYLATGEAPRRVGNRHPLSAPFGAFAARDGSFVLAVLNDKLFQRLAACIGAPEIAADPRFTTDSDRLANEGALRALIEGWSRRLGAREAVEALVAHGVPAAEINDMAEALASPHAEARGLLQEVSDARAGMRQVPEQPARFAGAPRGGLAAAPRLDGDRAAILADLEDRT